MKISGDTGDRTAALFLLGALAFTVPALAVFGLDATVLGIPSLYVYLFAAWAVLIALMARTTRRGGGIIGRARRPPPTGADGGT